jgi:hypothetical protein
MRHTRNALLVVGTVLTALAVTLAGDNTSPRALLDRAVKAHGGQALLEKYPVKGWMIVFLPDRERHGVEAGRAVAAP